MQKRHKQHLGFAMILLTVVTCLLPWATSWSLNPRSPEAKLPAGRDATEYWDFVARFDSGHHLFTRFGITSEGPVKRAAFAIGHVVLPDGRSIFFEKAKLRKAWTLSEGGRHIQIGGNLLDLRDPLRRLRIDRKSNIIDLQFSLAVPEPTAVNPARDGYSVDVLHTSAPVQGTLSLDQVQAEISVSGRIAGVHTWTVHSEPEVMLRRIEFFSLSSPIGLYLSELTAINQTRSGWLTMDHNGKLVHRTKQFTLQHEGAFDAGYGTGYALPSTLRILGDEVQGDIHFDKLLARDNPLKIIPPFVRFLIAYKTSPRRIWVETPYTIKLPAATPSGETYMRGTGLTMVVFGNPLTVASE